MSYDLQEQEQLDAMKAWWRTHGNRVTGLAIVALLGVLAYYGWSSYVLRQATEASVLYEEFERAAASKDPKDATKARDLAGTLIDRHASTVYAALAALREAKANLDANDPKAAEAQLTWVAQHAAQKELALLARVRLAGLQLDAKAYDQALKTLDVDVPEAFAGEFADRRGDVYAAQGKVAEARAAYTEALGKPSGRSLQPLIELKRDALPATAAVAGK